MKLEKFKEKDNKKRITIGISIVLILLVAGIIVYRSFAFYEEKKAFDVIKGQVPDQNYDLKLSYYVDNNYQENMPEGTNYSVSVTCSDGAKGEWDYESWGPVITNLTKTRTKCKISFQTGGYKEDILNGMDPVLASGLIPVTIEDNGTVKKADTRTEWYRYANQRWANAVILENESITYQNGEVIPESNIESYFVWIPKYRYKLWDLGQYTSLTSIDNSKVHDIDIIFGEYDTTDKEGECKTPGVSGSTGNCKVGDYMTHPAFQAFGVKGLWVGKFETGYKGATTTAGAQQNVNDTSKIEVKPNVYSWRNIQPANMHLNSYNYKIEYDSHMMKNTEWGAVAYLQHSIYGSRKSVRINNNEAMITGYSAKNEPTCGWTNDNRDCNKYDSTALGVDGTNTYNYLSTRKDSEGNIIADLASTTANKSGIYDMSGGASEYMMGVMTYSGGALCVGRKSTYTSGFLGVYCEDGKSVEGKAIPEEKYYDKYAYGTSDTQFQNGILGDATKEMGPFANVVYGSQTRRKGSWYADESWFIYNLNPWFSRGYWFSCGSGAGIFTIAYNQWDMLSLYGGFRIVLAI